MMRIKYGRMVPKGQAYFVHVMSRVVDRRFVLGEKEKEYFVLLMRRLAAFSGIEVLTYCIMDNHVHLLCYVPEKKILSDAGVLSRLRLIYTRRELGEVQQRLERFRGYATPYAYAAEREKHLRRMYDLGEFMKALKQQFTRWYNRKHGRTGTLWEARYKSVVVEGAGDPLLTMATYIDLNPVRAGLCADPSDYRWCGYGEALSGSRTARAGLKKIVEVMDRSTDWRLVQRTYRLSLYGVGEEQGIRQDGQAARRGFKRERVVQVWENGGDVSREELLRCRVRYFVDGLAIGSQEFLAAFVEQFHERFGRRRLRPCSRMKGAGFGGMNAIRDLQVDVIT